MANKLIIYSFIICVSLLTGFRDVWIGSDTESYIDIFDMFSNSGRNGFEIGFYYFIWIIQKISVNSKFIFFVISFSIIYFLVKSFILISPNNIKRENIFFLFSVLLLSNWFFVATVNNLRQSLGLSILFFSISNLYIGNYYKYIFFGVVSLLFHDSIILLFPLIFCFFNNKFSMRKYFVGYIVFSLGYFFGITEKILEKLSEYFGIDFFNKIKFYGDDGFGNAPWSGFDFGFYLYSIFWVLLYLIMKVMKLFSNNEAVSFFVKFYMVLNIFYFIFGFGGFSNRWAYPSWLFIPILQSIFFSSINGMRWVKKSTMLILFPSVIYFSMRIFGQI